MSERVCVIIPGRGTIQTLAACLDSVLAQQYAEREVIFVDDGVDAVTQTVLSSYKDKVRVLASGKKGPSAARNLAVQATDASWCAFTDSDCLAAPDWLDELFRGVERFPDAVACGGIQKLPENATNFEKKVAEFFQCVGGLAGYTRQAGSDEIQAVSHNASCNCMYRRADFLALGGFREGLWPGEDVEFDYRLSRGKKKIICNPRAAVYHYRPRTWRAFSRMMYRYGTSQARLVRMHGVFRFVQAVPLISLIALMGFCLLTAVAPAFMTLMSVMALVVCLWLFCRRKIFLMGLCITAVIAWHGGFVRGLFNKI